MSRGEESRGSMKLSHLAGVLANHDGTGCPAAGLLTTGCRAHY